jgi:hypothetical protein
MATSTKSSPCITTIKEIFVGFATARNTTSKNYVRLKPSPFASSANESREGALLHVRVKHSRLDMSCAFDLHKASVFARMRETVGKAYLGRQWSARHRHGHRHASLHFTRWARGWILRARAKRAATRLQGLSKGNSVRHCRQLLEPLLHQYRLLELGLPDAATLHRCSPQWEQHHSASDPAGRPWLLGMGRA